MYYILYKKSGDVSRSICFNITNALEAYISVTTTAAGNIPTVNIDAASSLEGVHNVLVDRRISSQDIIDQTFNLFVFKSIPENIRSDSGPAFTGKVIRSWLNHLGVKTLFIDYSYSWEVLGRTGI